MKSCVVHGFPWLKNPKPCKRLVFKDVDVAKHTNRLNLRVLLQMFIITCCALEKISLSPIM